MNFTNELTIAIPVFERKDFFIEALKSALNQTINCKIIVVDNGSSHNFFRETCLDYDIPYYKNKSNIGMFANWNKCFEYSDTNFVMLLGDDDILDENYVYYFTKALEVYDNIDVFFSNFEILYNNTKEIVNHRHVLPFGYMEGNRIVEYGVFHRLGFPVIASAIKKEKFSGFYTDFHASNDWVWIYENATLNMFFGEDKKLLKYRYHEKNDTKTPRVSLNCRISCLYIYKNIINNNSDNVEYKNQIKKNIRFEKLFIYSNIERKYFNLIINENNKYSKLLSKETSNLVKLYLFIPQQIRILFFKVITKLNLLNA